MWGEAVRLSSGYDTKEILDKVLAATLKVKNSEAAYERDSVLFDEVHYSWPVTAALMWVAARNGGRLSVLDFGGSLGSSYFQNKEFLRGLSAIRWSVVEQQHFVEAGRKYIQNEDLIFFESIDECLDREKPNVVLVSSVIQYLEKPYDLLSKLLGTRVGLVIIDRTPFLNTAQTDQVYIQLTPASIYSARYPIWFLNKGNFLNTVSSKGYTSLVEFDAIDRLNESVTWTGMLLALKHSY